MTFVVDQFEVLEGEIEDVFDIRVDLHGWQCERFPCQLCCYLLHMVGVEMSIAKGMDEIAQLKIADLCNHHGEQGIRGDIKRNTEEDISTALVELAGEFSISHVELEKGVAWR